MKKKTSSPEQWTSEWINSVASGSKRMSGRKLTSIEKRGGGLKAVASAARKRKVHLLLFKDDQECDIVAASTKPFKVIV